MMLQMPIVLVQRSKYVKGHTLLNVSGSLCSSSTSSLLTCVQNVIFWCSMISGLAIVSQASPSHDTKLTTLEMCALYVLV